MSVLANQPQTVSMDELAQKETAGMSLGDAINLVDEREESNELMRAERVFWERLKELPEEAYEARGTTYYYLLCANIKISKLFEGEKARGLYEKMQKCFRDQMGVYQERLAKERGEKLVRLQYHAFLKLVERYFFALELIYRKKDWADSMQTAYAEKMYYRQCRLAFEHRYLEYTFFKFLQISCNYGQNLWRWGAVSLIFILLYGLMFAGFDIWQTGGMLAQGGGFWDYIYFSAVTFTTLGYGDIVPITLFQKLLIGVEAVSGYLMLGSFMAILQRKMR